jgi:hypothetical protein
VALGSSALGKRIDHSVRMNVLSYVVCLPYGSADANRIIQNLDAARLILKHCVSGSGLCPVWAAVSSVFADQGSNSLQHKGGSKYASALGVRATPASTSKGSPVHDH